LMFHPAQTPTSEQRGGPAPSGSDHRGADLDLPGLNLA
jgi:hypothetical protein